MMEISSQASFSDAHEIPAIPIIAANLHRAILPRQSQIWSVIRKSDDVKRISYSINAGILGRLCLSGNVTDLNNEQWETIDNGIAFYKAAAPYIKNGKSRLYRHTTGSDRHPKGYQAVVRSNEQGTLVTVHTFGGDIPEEIKVTIPTASKITASYSHKPVNASTYDNGLVIKNAENFAGYSFILN